jgi:hypothetical protein
MRKETNTQLPVFMHEPKTVAFLKEVTDAIPASSEAFLVGGGARNAVYHRMFGNSLPQRDYDIVVTCSLRTYVKRLAEKGFLVKKGIRRKGNIVMHKARVPKPKTNRDYLVLDLHSTTNMRKDLREETNFTMNGFAIPLSTITRADWYAKTMKLPMAERDLRAKRLRVNSYKMPTTLFAALRFMSLGFSAPSKAEIKRLLVKLTEIEEWRFERNVKKVFEYVGGERKARALVKRLGITVNIFDFDALREFRKNRS